jgi:hypothetical protein
MEGFRYQDAQGEIYLDFPINISDISLLPAFTSVGIKDTGDANPVEYARTESLRPCLQTK